MLVGLDVPGIELWDGRIDAFSVSVEIRLISCLHLIKLRLDGSNKHFLVVVFGFAVCFYDEPRPYVSEVDEPNTCTFSTLTSTTHESLILNKNKS
jgi:hypothetical protein